MQECLTQGMPKVEAGVEERWAALRVAVEESGPALQRYLAGMGASWDDAQDMAQEALLRAWQARAGFDGRAKPRTWIFSIARRFCLDMLRRGRVQARHGPQAARRLAQDSPSTPLALAQASEQAAALKRALEQLPAEQREALVLREYGGLSFEQAAQVLGVSPNTLKSRVRYALLKLARELQAFGDS